MTKLEQLIGEGRSIFASSLCLLTCGLLAPSALTAGGVSGASGNPMRYFRAEDAVAYSNCVHSITNVQQGGELYGMTWDKDADYHLGTVLKAGCTDGMSVMDFLCTNVLANAPRPTVAGFPGCTAFMATNSVGEHLVGRNCDYPLPMAHTLLFVPKNPALNRKYSSIGTVDGGWVGYDVGQLDDGKTDLSYAALFPYYCMDGMNEKGVSISILAVNARKRPGTGKADWMTEQFHANQTNIVLSVAIRYLLDNAGTAEEGVRLLEKFNVFAAIGGDLGLVSNYHLYFCDPSGDARVVEWMPPAHEGESWQFREVKDVKAVSNFCMVDGYGHGSNRWEIARHALARQGGHLETDDATDLCRAASQRKGSGMTSWTHWSVVYNLDALSANIATLGNYDEIFPSWFKEGCDAWEIGAAKSARPQVRTDLPEFPSDPKTAEPGKVYWLKDPIESATDKITEKPSYDGASVAAVNRQGLTYDAPGETLHAVATNAFGSTCRAVFYVDMSSRKPEKATESIVAGVNAKGLAGRVVKFKNSTGTGDVSPSETLRAVLSNSGTIIAALEMIEKTKQSAGGCGFVLSDQMGNVAVWGPEGAELETDDASEMVRNSLDLRQGIYEIDGAGRGEFDELPGLMRLASTTNTRSVVSMGYGHLDVFLPNEANVAWRVAVPDADVTGYGVIAEPTAVPHATASFTSADFGTPTVRNNRGQFVAMTDMLQKVTYTAEKGYYFPGGTNVWKRTFGVSKSVTTAPVPPTPGYTRVPDYTEATGVDWLFNHAITGKACPDEAAETAVDLFYVYPTLVGDEKIVNDGFRGIDDPTMRSGATNFTTAVGSYVNTARCFADMTHVYAPFYRQATLDTATDCATNAAGVVVSDANAKYLAKLCEGPAYGDVTNALSVYFAKWNKGRKLVLAAHSQGSAILRLVMENYFTLPENRDKAQRIVCSYQIGFGIGQSSVDAIAAATGVTFAGKADDTKVIVSYNTMGEGSSGNSVLLPGDTLAINPITWTRSGERADKSLNIGALTSDLGQADVIVPGLYGSQVVDTGLNRGQVVVCRELNDKVLAPNLFGTDSLHPQDYAAHWENLRANAYDRGGKLAGFAKLCTTNFPKHLCVSEAEVESRETGTSLVRPAGGTVWIQTNDLSMATVYLAPEKGYRLLREGVEVSGAVASLYPQNLKENGEFLIPADQLSDLRVEWIQRAPDYADKEGKDWLFHHDIAAKRYEGEPAQDPGVDLFYFYPTSVNVCDDHAVDGICDIDDEYLRSDRGGLSSWNGTAKVFGDFTRVYAPYYRQTPVDVEMSFPRDGTGYDKITAYWYGRAPYADVTNALTHYFTTINPNGKRPFVLAGHSHGAGMLVLAMEHFFKDHPRWLDKMVACYAIGMGVSDTWEESVKGYAPIATNATDVGVYVFWNTEGPGTSEKMISGLWPTNHVAGVNPITWTRTDEYAPASLNLGGFTADDSGAIRPCLYDASNNVAHGTVVCSSPDLAARYMDAAWGFGEKSLHGWDYKIYWENLRANALQRIKTMKAELGEPDYAQIPLAGTPIDYGDPYNWVTNTGSTKPLDVLYVYPTMMLAGDSTVVPVTDAMKEKAYANAYVESASAFAGYANVLIPAYRQINGAAVGVATTLYPEPSDFIDYMKGLTPRTDLFAALDYYFTNLNANANRPFVLAGHSQGSAMLKIVFEDYFRSNGTRKGYLAKMVAAYPLGYSFSSDWCAANGVPFATNETDTAVVISWNTEGPNAQERSFVIGSGALAINPMNWTTNANAWAGTEELSGMIQQRTATDHAYAPGTYSLVTTNRTDYLPTAGGMGEKSLHGYDWKLWYDQIKANGFTRYAAFADVQEAVTNGLPAVADTICGVKVKGEGEQWTDASVSPLDGRLYVPAGASDVRVVYTLDAGKAAEGYCFVDGTTEVSFPMEKEGGAWVSKTTKAEIEAATKMGKPSDFVIASDFSANPPFEDWNEEEGTFDWNGRTWTVGENAFTSFTAAFSHELFSRFATNVHVFGAQTIASEPPKVAAWNLDLVAYDDGEDEMLPVVTVAKDDASGVLVSITNKLGRITGKGMIVLGTTKVGPSIYRDFIDEEAEIDVVNSGVEPTAEHGSVVINVDDKAKTETDEETGATGVVLPGVEKAGGDIVVSVGTDATNDVVVAGKLEARGGTVRISNRSTNDLLLAAAVYGEKVRLLNDGNRDGVEGSITAADIRAAGDVTIVNDAHLEANVAAGGKVSITNSASQTMVGTYAGETVEIWGDSCGALSNVTFTAADRVRLYNFNVLTGPLDIKSPVAFNAGFLICSICGGNKTATLSDLRSVSVTITKNWFGAVFDLFGQPNGCYTLARNAKIALSMGEDGKGLELQMWNNANGLYIPLFTVKLGAGYVSYGRHLFRLDLTKENDLVLTVADVRTHFGFLQNAVSSGGSVTVKVWGGSETKAVQATVSSVKNTGWYSSAYVDGKRVSFPLTLNWEKGEMGFKEILFRIPETDSAEDRFFTLQLAAPVGEEILPEHDVCTVKIKGSGAAGGRYVRALAYPANGGTVSGYGSLASERSARTLTAKAKNGSLFAGWYRAKADNADAIDLDAPATDLIARPKKPEQIKVGWEDAGTYFAYFTNVLQVAAVVEPQAFDAWGRKAEGVEGVTAQEASAYATMVGVKFALPVAIEDASGKGKLTIKGLPSGLSLKQDFWTKDYRIVGIPTKAGLFAATFAASNAAGKHTVTYLFLVDDIPANAVGTFYGVIGDDEPGGSHRTGVGSVTFTAGAKGNLSAKVVRRLSGTRSFSVKGYDYIDAETLGVAMTNAYDEVFEATLSLKDGTYDTTLVGTAFGGEKKGTLGYYGETDGLFLAVRSAFAAKDDKDAKQVIAAYRGTYAADLFETNGIDAVGSVLYRVNADGSVYVAQKIDKTSETPARTLTGTAPGGFLYNEERGLGGCASALRGSGNYLWSSEVLFDEGMREVSGAARYIRPDPYDRSETLDDDQLVGEQ